MGKPWPEPWPATELEAMMERLEEIVDAAEGEGWTAVAHKVKEALGPLMSAALASAQYADGTLEVRW